MNERQHAFGSMRQSKATIIYVVSKCYASWCNLQHQQTKQTTAQCFWLVGHIYTEVYFCLPLTKLIDTNHSTSPSSGVLCSVQLWMLLVYTYNFTCTCEHFMHCVLNIHNQLLQLLSHQHAVPMLCKVYITHNDFHIN